MKATIHKILNTFCYQFFLLLPFSSWAQEYSKLPAFSLIQAITKTLENNWDIKNQIQNVNFYLGNYQATKGIFDYNLNTSVQKNIQNSPQYTIQDKIIHQYSDIFSYQIGITKQLRNGIIINPNILGTITEIQYENKNYYPTKYQNQVNVNLAITIPLLQNSGTTVCTANQLAAKFLYEANVKKLNHIVASAIYYTIANYWAYSAAFQQWNFMKLIVANEKTYFEQIKSLAKSDIIPKADTLQSYANVVNYQYILSQYYEKVINARNNLITSIGINTLFSDSIGMPADTLPFHINSQVISNLNFLYSLDFYKKRSDYQSAILSIESYKHAVINAENFEKPQLNLNLSAGYTGFQPSNTYQPVSSFSKNIKGISVWTTLSLQYPFGNNTAKGYKLQSKANYEQGKLQLQQLQQTIISNLQLSVEVLKNIMNEYQKLSSNIVNYENIRDNERIKYKNNESTLIDVNKATTQWLETYNNYIGIIERYYVEIAKIRFITGVLITQEQQNIINKNQIMTLPVQEDFK